MDLEKQVIKNVSTALQALRVPPDTHQGWGHSLASSAASAMEANSLSTSFVPRTSSRLRRACKRPSLSYYGTNRFWLFPRDAPFPGSHAPTGCWASLAGTPPLQQQQLGVDPRQSLCLGSSLDHLPESPSSPRNSKNDGTIANPRENLQPQWVAPDTWMMRLMTCGSTSARSGCPRAATDCRQWCS